MITYSAKASGRLEAQLSLCVCPQLRPFQRAVFISCTLPRALCKHPLHEMFVR